MVDREILDNLVVSIRKYLKELQDADDIDWETFVQDNRSRRFVERVLQILVESMIDLGQHIIADQGFREPNTYRDVFRILVEEGVLEENKLTVYEKIASFRNVLVHPYEGIDNNIVFGIFKKNLPDIEDFLNQIFNWLEQKQS